MTKIPSPTSPDKASKAMRVPFGDQRGYCALGHNTEEPGFDIEVTFTLKLYPEALTIS
jgi:hypothetical protein